LLSKALIAAGRVSWVALVLVLVSTCVTKAEEDRLEPLCHTLLQRYVLDCGCTTAFLQEHLGADQADILLKLWVYGANGDNHRSELLSLYLRYGSERINESVMNFHRHRDQLRLFCVNGEGPMIAD
jgi:hypothetical protein